ncbi:MAG TPA: hypothetical protein VLY63_07870, partial [Anaerolineae bacterium]|nr:hypothetical protein [Anaerolineae bacterium]
MNNQFAQRPRHRLYHHVIRVIYHQSADRQRAGNVTRPSMRADVERHGAYQGGPSPPAIFRLRLP